MYHPNCYKKSMQFSSSYQPPTMSSTLEPALLIISESTPNSVSIDSTDDSIPATTINPICERLVVDDGVYYAGHPKLASLAEFRSRGIGGNLLTVKNTDPVPTEVRLYLS